jgi:hypothetical protein
MKKLNYIIGILAFVIVIILQFLIRDMLSNNKKINYFFYYLKINYPTINVLLIISAILLLIFIVLRIFNNSDNISKCDESKKEKSDLSGVDYKVSKWSIYLVIIGLISMSIFTLYIYEDMMSKELNSSMFLYYMQNHHIIIFCLYITFIIVTLVSIIISVRSVIFSRKITDTTKYLSNKKVRVLNAFVLVVLLVGF